MYIILMSHPRSDWSSKKGQLKFAPSLPLLGGGKEL